MNRWLIIIIILTAAAGITIAATFNANDGAVGPTDSFVQPKIDVDPGSGTVDFTGYVWMSLLLESRDGSESVPSQDEIALRLAVNDFTEYLADKDAPWGMVARVVPFGADPTEALEALQHDGVALLQELYGDSPTPYEFQILAISSGGSGGDGSQLSGVEAYAKSYDVVLISTASPPSQYKQNDALDAAIMDATGTTPSAQAYATYDAVWIYGLTIERLGTIQVDSLKEALPDVATNYGTYLEPSTDGSIFTFSSQQ